MEFRIAQVALDQVCDTGRLTLHPFYNKYLADDLAASIAGCGIITPPVLLENGADYEIVCGRQRLLASATVLKVTSCTCRVLPESSSAEELLTVIVEDQFATGGLSLVEQAVFLGLCRKMLPDEGRNTFLNKIGPGRITKGTHFLLTLNSFPAILQEKIHRKRISEKVIGELQILHESDQLRFIELVECLQVGGNQQKKMIQQLIDISKREQVSVESLLQRYDLQGILDDKTTSVLEKSSRLMMTLSRIHQPLLSHAQQSFAAEIQKLKLPQYCLLQPTQSFEKDEVTCIIRFESLQQFQEIWQKIRPYLP